MITTFFKCVFLVIAAGIVHSLVFLPVILTTTLPVLHYVRDLCYRHMRTIC